jgi:hypothetical protein
MSEKPKRKMTEKQLENLRLGRERAHERMRGLKSESKQLSQFRNAQPEPELYEEDDSSDEELLLKRYNKPKPVVLEVPTRKPRAKKEINIESKRLELEAKLLEKEYEMKMKKIEKEEPKVEEVKPVDPPKPRPRVRIG